MRAVMESSSDSGATRAAVHVFRHHSKEVAGPYGGFQNVRAGLQTRNCSRACHTAPITFSGDV